MITSDAIAFYNYIKPISFKFDKFDLGLIIEALKASISEPPYRGCYQSGTEHRSQMFCTFHLTRRLSDMLLKGRKSYTVRLNPHQIAVLQQTLHTAAQTNSRAMVIYMTIHQKTIL